MDIADMQEAVTRLEELQRIALERTREVQAEMDEVKQRIHALQMAAWEKRRAADAARLLEAAREVGWRDSMRQELSTYGLPPPAPQSPPASEAARAALLVEPLAPDFDRLLAAPADEGARDRILNEIALQLRLSGWMVNWLQQVGALTPDHRQLDLIQQLIYDLGHDE